MSYHIPPSVRRKMAVRDRTPEDGAAASSVGAEMEPEAPKPASGDGKPAGRGKSPAAPPPAD